MKLHIKIGELEVTVILSKVVKISYCRHTKTGWFSYFMAINSHADKFLSNNIQIPSMIFLKD